jgi:hypothetical protein
VICLAVTGRYGDSTYGDVHLTFLSARQSGARSRCSRNAQVRNWIFAGGE